MLVTHSRAKLLNQSDFPASTALVAGLGLHAASGDCR